MYIVQNYFQHGNMTVTQQKMPLDIDFAIRGFWGNYWNMLGWHFHEDGDDDDDDDNDDVDDDDPCPLIISSTVLLR